MGNVVFKLIGVVLLLIVVTLGIGYMYQNFMQWQNDKEFPPPGTLFDVDGVQIHMVCAGEGEPWIMMEGGLTMDVLGWDYVWKDLAKITRVCAYDRPGLGWSENIDTIKRGPDVAKTLHKLLEISGQTGDYVMLGMSAGGVYVRDFYSLFPERVSGMIFVDSSHEQQGNRFPAELLEAGSFESQIRLCELVAPFGIVRLFGLTAQLIDEVYSDPPEYVDLDRVKSRYNRTLMCTALLREMESFNADVTRVMPPQSLGDLPLLVLSQGKDISKEELPEGVTLEVVAQQAKIWAEMQAELSGLSTQGRQVVVHNSGHLIQFEQPEILIEEVSRLIQSIRHQVEP